MRIESSPVLLAALGVLSLAPTPSMAQDTSKWTCASCPYPEGAIGAVDAGVGGVSGASNKFGDYTGLQRKQAHLVLGGQVSYRNEDGYFADLSASDLGIDSRSISATSGHEGLFKLQLGYAEIPRHFGDGASTPFLGVGGGNLTLPAGYPAATTAAMPLASTLQPVDLGFNFKRSSLGATFLAGTHWSFQVNARHDVRDGTRPMGASFYSATSQLPVQIAQVTDQVEVSASYADRRMQGRLTYLLSQFTDNQPGVIWDNPFNPVVSGATRGQIALPPDNQFQQVSGSAGYAITPKIRASGEFAVGQLTQNEPYVATTLNTGLAVGALPATSLDGQVDTFNGSARITAEPIERLRLVGSYSRDVHDNRTSVQSYVQVATDMFVDPGTRSNTPFTIKQDRYKLSADYRGESGWKLGAGADQDDRQRSYTEVVKTRETTVWARASVQPLEELSLALKLAHAQRDNNGYGVATWFGAPENPLMRKYNLADRQRDSASLHADYAFSDEVSLGLSADYANDDYKNSLVGLTDARSVNLAADLSWTVSERTRLSAYAQGEHVRSHQAGSQAFAAPDWTATSKDRFEVAGIGLKHAAIVDKLDIGADLSHSRATGELIVAAGTGDPPFPNAQTTIDTVKLFANYRLNEKLSLIGSVWYERYRAQDWRLDGVLPGTVSNLLALGQQSPNYTVGVLRIAARYRF